MLRLAIDFDGVIHDPTNVKPGYKLGVPVDGAFEALWQLKNDGAIIVIHCVWANTEASVKAIGEWLNYFKMPYDFVTNIKPEVDLYIDDKGYRFQTWVVALEFIKKLDHQRLSRD